MLISLSVKEELLVLAKVPELNRRTSCCLATLINAYAVLCASKAKPEAPAEGNAARQSHWVCAVSVVRNPFLLKVAGMGKSPCGVWKPRLYSRKRIRRGGFTFQANWTNRTSWKSTCPMTFCICRSITFRNITCLWQKRHYKINALGNAVSE